MVLSRKKKGFLSKGKKTAVKTKCSSRTIDEATLSRMIQERAYYMWEELGKPHGNDGDIWMRAEKEICAKVK
jgi:hypothetical protein